LTEINQINTFFTKIDTTQKFDLRLTMDGMWILITYLINNWWPVPIL
jgi:hypothetical protein